MHPLKTFNQRYLRSTLTVLIVATSLLVLGPRAWAHSCPLEMNKIDQRLLQKLPLSPEKLEEVRRLRAEGERLHRQEKHGEAMLVLGSAKKILGID